MQSNGRDSARAKCFNALCNTQDYNEAPVKAGVLVKSRLPSAGLLERTLAERSETCPNAGLHFRKDLILILFLHTQARGMPGSELV